MKDYERALDYYQQALRLQEKVLGKTHPFTVGTVMNMATMYYKGFKDYVKAEEMYRHALDGYAMLLGKEHEEMKNCARKLAVLLADGSEGQGEDQS